MMMNAGKSPTFLIAALIGVFIGLTAGPAAYAAELLGVRFGPNGEATRIVFDLAGEADYTLSGDGTGNGKLLVNFSNLSVPAADRGFRPGKGHIGRYGFAMGAGASQAVFEFKKTAKIKEVFMIEPQGSVTKYRLVIDLVTAEKKDFLASLPQEFPDLTAVIRQATAEETPLPVLSPPSAPPKDTTPTPPQLAKRQVVMIDAGHGGRDPGSQGQSGTYEKTVTLAAAMELAAILKKRGDYEIVLTRDKDVRIQPDKVEEHARDAKADLFISLHADAISKPAVRGASVYTLSEKGSARSAKLAKSHGDLEVNDVDLEGYDQLVGDILLDKAQSETSTASSYLAKILIDHLSPKTPMLNRSHRTANLRVLLAPDVPAVLLEMAFISNSKDEANLKSRVWRKRSMTAVADAIDQYFDDYAGQRLASNQSEGAN